MYLEVLTCMVSYGLVYAPFMQLKAYARVQSKPEISGEEDRMFVSLGYAYDKDLIEHVVLRRSQIGENLTLVAFVLLTVLIGLVLVWLATQYYGTLWKNMNSQNSIKQGSTNEESTGNNDKNSGSHVKLSLYWSTAFVFCCFNICNSGAFIIAHLLKHPNLTASDDVILNAFITKMVTILFLCILHLGVATFTVHRSTPKADHCNNSEEPQSTHRMCSCCFPYEYKLKVLHILALYNIVIFIQTIGTAAIPLFVLLLLYKFTVLSILAFMSSSTFCFINLIAHILLLNRSANKKSGGKSVLLLQACIILIFLTVIGVFVAFYLFLLSRGVNTSGLQGVLLSLLPTFTLSAGGWYVKEKVLKKKVVTTRSHNPSTRHTETQL